jgi:transmembrane sensor
LSNQQILEEAAEWLVALRKGADPSASREKFADWLRASPEHVRAYLELTAVWSEVARVGHRDSLAAKTLLERARADNNVARFSDWRERVAAEVEPADSKSVLKSTKRHRMMAAAAAVLCIVFGAGLWHSQRLPTYSAGIGEQRSLTLADGSIVELNSRSRIRVRFSSEQRVVELLAGQGLFRVAHNAQRPFIVRSGAVQVRAVGTQFDVYQRPGGTVVTVVEGKVEVTDLASQQLREPTSAAAETASSTASASASSRIRLAAGEQVTVGEGGTAVPRSANVAAATAWTQRQLVFEAVPLAAVVQEFNRYNLQQLIIEDRALDGLLISGVFSSTNTAALLHFLRAQADLQVQETNAEVRIATHARGSSR